MSEFARNWGRTQIARARAAYEAAPTAYNREAVLKELKELEDDLSNWTYAFED